MNSPTLNPHSTQTLLHNPANHVDQTTQNNAMKKFQEFIFKLAETLPNAPLTPAGKTVLEGRLNQFVSDYKTPDHPPYSAMIEDALQKLNEKGDSSEESISQYLEKAYDNLPWAHSVLLKHHLQKLCESGDIAVHRNKRYGLAGSLNLNTEVKERRPSRKCWLDWEIEEKGRRKKRSKKKANGQKGEDVEIKKHREYDEQEQRLTEIEVHSEVKCDLTKISLSFVDGENSGSFLLTDPLGLTVVDETIYSDTVRSQVKADILALDTQREEFEYNQPEISSPERSPGYKMIGVKKLPHSGSREVALPLAEENVELKRTRRQLKRWSLTPEPKAVTLTSSKSESIETSQDQEKAFDSTPITVEQIHHEKQESEDDVELVQMNGTKLKRDRRYGWRKKNRSKKSGNSDGPTELQNEHPFEPYTTIDSPILCVDLNQAEFALSNKQESDEMPQEPSSRRSLRARPAKQKPDAADVENLRVVDDPRGQYVKQSVKTVDCTSLCEKMEPHTAEVVPRERRRGRPPRCPSS